MSSLAKRVANNTHCHMITTEPMVVLSLALGLLVITFHQQEEEISTAEEQEKKAQEFFTSKEIRECITFGK